MSNPYCTLAQRHEFPCGKEQVFFHLQFKAIAVVSEQESLCDDLSGNPDRCGKAMRHLHDNNANRMFEHQLSRPDKQARTT